MRWHDEDTDGNTNENNDGEQYYLYDASFNVIALMDEQGTVLERYRYTPYGQRIVLDADFTQDADNASDFAQQRGFQGLRHDEESGLIYNRARMLDPLTGRFVQRDPLGYPDGMNSYAAYHVMWGGVDPMGRKTIKGTDIRDVPKYSKGKPAIPGGWEDEGRKKLSSGYEVDMEDTINGTSKYSYSASVETKWTKGVSVKAGASYKVSYKGTGINGSVEVTSTVTGTLSVKASETVTGTITWDKYKAIPWTSYEQKIYKKKSGTGHKLKCPGGWTKSSSGTSNGYYGIGKYCYIYCKKKYVIVDNGIYVAIKGTTTYEDSRSGGSFDSIGEVKKNARQDLEQAIESEIESYF